MNGVRIHFVDEGAGEPAVLVHGDPTWGFLHRRFIPPLARRRRCIVPDHMGMGKSETPAAPYPYRLSHHIGNLEALLLELDLHTGTLVLHDIIRSDRGERFVLERNGYLQPALTDLTCHRERLTPAVMAAYRAPFPAPESRLALLCWSRDISVAPEDAPFGEMRRIEEGLRVRRHPAPAGVGHARPRPHPAGPALVAGSRPARRHP